MTPVECGRGTTRGGWGKKEGGGGEPLLWLLLLLFLPLLLVAFFKFCAFVCALHNSHSTQENVYLFVAAAAAEVLVVVAVFCQFVLHFVRFLFLGQNFAVRVRFLSDNSNKSVTQSRPQNKKDQSSFAETESNNKRKQNAAEDQVYIYLYYS